MIVQQKIHRFTTCSLYILQSRISALNVQVRHLTLRLMPHVKYKIKKKQNK